MNVAEMFPKPLLSKAALKRSGVWQEMMIDIWQCRTARELLRCQLEWSATISTWPDDDELGWTKPAAEEFEKARIIIEALAAQQAE